MEAEELARREPHATDSRAVLLRATAKGRRILERGRHRRLDLLESLLGETSPREIAVVREAASIVERALSA